MAKKATFDWMEPSFCPICGKEFYPTPDWVYRSGARRVCSWTCVLRGRKPDRRRVKRREKPVEMFSPSGELLLTFDSAAQAAERLGYTPDGVRDACRSRGSFYHGYLWRYKEGM